MLAEWELTLKHTDRRAICTDTADMAYRSPRMRCRNPIYASINTAATPD